MLPMPETLLEPLRPVYAARWPESEERVVNVLCEGPTACLDPDALQAACKPGPVLAVNRAIAFSGHVPIDCWATMDDPRLLWKWAEPYLHSETKLFSGDDTPNIILWRDILGESELGRLYTRVPAYMDQLDAGDGRAPMVPTLFHALAWCLQVGVREAHLIGVDMCGSSSPLTPETWSPVEDEGDRFRWAIERKFLALSMKHYRARGARITRWNRTRNL